MKEEKDIRPVRCYICGRKMYYIEHSKHEKELEIYENESHRSYIHANCLKLLRKVTYAKRTKGEGK